jgi:8-oxo-dGTP pyrophosphatase MutT (NUDIX family)
MANSKLYGKTYFTLPENVINDIKAALQKYGAANGSERARNLITNPKVSYSLAKKLKSYFDNFVSHDGSEATFSLYGGKSMKNWLNTVLGGSRNAIQRTKTVKANGGMDNQFIKNHEKNHIKPTKIETGTSMIPKTKRMELFESIINDDIDNLAAICIIFNSLGQLLLLQRSETDTWMPEKWALAGGGVKVDEEIEDSVAREIKEETNLDVKGILFSFTTKEDKTRVHVFMAKCDNTDQINIDDSEHSDFRWVNINEIEELETVPNLKEYVIKALSLFKEDMKKEKPTA